MILTRLIYCSKTDIKQGDEALEKIIAASRRNNTKVDVTGALLLKDGYFMQCIEGRRELVNQVYRRVCQDERHDDVRLLFYSEVNERYFAGWDMTMIPTVSAILQLNCFRYSTHREFDPTTLRSHGADELMKTLADIMT